MAGLSEKSINNVWSTDLSLEYSFSVASHACLNKLIKLVINICSINNNFGFWGTTLTYGKNNNNN